MNRIVDEFSKRTDISRQRRYQLRGVRDGKCAGCRRPAVQEYCDECRQKRTVQSREAARVRTGAKKRLKGAKSYSFGKPKKKR